MAGNKFTIDDDMGRLLEGLAKIYGTFTRAQTLRRVLALNMAAARYVGEDGVLTLRDMRPGAPRDAMIAIPVR
jgi:hypothetical protein